MKRTPFGNVAASLSPKNREGAIILSHDAARHLRAHLQWMRGDKVCKDIAQALKWVEENTSEEIQAYAERAK